MVVLWFFCGIEWLNSNVYYSLLLQLDLSSQTSIKQFVSMFTMKKRKLHVLINNASIKLPADDFTLKPTHDKVEVTMATNHIG